MRKPADLPGGPTRPPIPPKTALPARDVQCSPFSTPWPARLRGGALGTAALLGGSGLWGAAQALAPADPVGPLTFDERINAAVSPVSSFLSSVIFASVSVGGVSVPLIVVWLFVAAIIFTLTFRFINFSGFWHAVQIATGRYDRPDDDAPGTITHFQALTTAVSGTVGLGNIAGVAVAISLGGPGATFWMILAGLLGMSTKFVECTLGVKYREIQKDGRVDGGPMFYLRDGLAEVGRARLGRIMAAVFAVCMVFASLGGGNMFQSNQAYQQIVNATGGPASPLNGNGWLAGLVLAVLVGAVILGGIRSIANVTGKLVPMMAALYILSVLVILGLNFSAIPAAFGAIISGAFSPQGVAGGVIGVMIQGIRRATFSNEAGIGSAAIAHSPVKTRRPVTEGFVGLLEPFLDTVVICTMTALAIVITGAYTQAGLDGVGITDTAFRSVAPWFSWLLTVAVVMFAYSTMISYAYYGTRAVRYLFGPSELATNVFKVVFLVFIVIGASMNLGSVIDFSDAMLFSMSIPNIIGLYFLIPVVKRELANYRADLKAGRVQPAPRNG
ncbi:alanine/glycine:cation symporter family protein [Deinococcus knuensis]|uniref:Alanine glycine permease n=1 Tax=Deinococcus knuensis TaxID=1837380 RepID=A0ABQ2SEP7_9DEIO|nr:alanine/glycine:cation symporter family protein [Deinococcus knuensis]GGS18752.1 alanine glycine permease [Deinococcus knuensis]